MTTIAVTAEAGDETRVAISPETVKKFTGLGCKVLVEAGEPESRFRVRLSSAVDAEVAAPFVEVTPAVDFRLRAQGNELVVEGEFVPGNTYRLRLA